MPLSPVPRSSIPFEWTPGLVPTSRLLWTTRVDTPVPHALGGCGRSRINALRRRFGNILFQWRAEGRWSATKQASYILLARQPPIFRFNPVQVLQAEFLCVHEKFPAASRFRVGVYLLQEVHDRGEAGSLHTRRHEYRTAC